MNRKELEKEICETNLTIIHLARIGEVDTAIQMARYLDQLFELRNKVPNLKLVKTS